MGMQGDDRLGQGSYSICRRGTNIATGETVAIKTYKESRMGNHTTLERFKRQVDVLLELQKPFQPDAAGDLWHDELSMANPCDLFMRLLDYSKTPDGPGPDPRDNVMYVITELAQQSLKEFLASRRENLCPIAKESVRRITRTILLIVAGLHAQSFVHLDLKPDNLMMFNGVLKLIDVDGCVKIGTKVSLLDSSLSFSPCYCAPEWSRFLISDTDDACIDIHPGLDAWSTGVTICELVSLRPILKETYANFSRAALNNDEAGYLFLNWLGAIKKVPLPENVEEHDPEFLHMITHGLLACSQDKRSSCAQCLSSPYISRIPEQCRQPSEFCLSKRVTDSHRIRCEDNSQGSPLFKGTMWKLSSKGDPQDDRSWLKRDMWLTQQGALCYFSCRSNTRLVLIDESALKGAEIVPLNFACKDHAFMVSPGPDDQGKACILACSSQEEHDQWTRQLKGVACIDSHTMQLASQVQLAPFRKFVVSVKNRRQKIEPSLEDEFSSIFKAKLWKLKVGGDRMNNRDWCERVMWITKNGSLAYRSEKDGRDLVYYRFTDLSSASLTRVPPNKSCRPFTFSVHIPELDTVEFTPGEFAANSEDLFSMWIEEFGKVSNGFSSLKSEH
jgi:serine/threonine protein kinase